MAKIKVWKINVVADESCKKTHLIGDAYDHLYSTKKEARWEADNIRDRAFSQYVRGNQKFDKFRVEVVHTIIDTKDILPLIKIKDLERRVYVHDDEWQA